MISASLIPPEMHGERRFCVWRIETPPGKDKPTKVPYRADGRGKASSTDPTTWGTMEDAISTAELGDYAGIGFFLGDGWAGVDLDDCYGEGEYPEWGSEIISGLDTYWEISPSGTGAKGFLKGRKPEGITSCSKRGFGPQKIGRLEVYDRDRFFAITGNIIEGKPLSVKDCNGSFSALCETYLRSDQRGNVHADQQRNCHADQFHDSGTDHHSGNYRNGNSQSDSVSHRYRACLATMIRKDMQDAGDGSRRLYAYAGCCVEFDLSDADAIRCIRDCAKVLAFPTQWTDQQIIDRIRDAEKKTTRGKAAEASEPAPEPMPLGDMWKSDSTLAEPIIDGLLRRGEVGNLISTSKSYKTYLILCLAISMVVCRQWLDRFGCRGGRVLIIDLELQKPSITRRTIEIAKEMHADLNTVAEGIDVISFRGRTGTIDQIEKLLLAAEPGEWDLVIVDPLYKTYPAGFDENSNAQMTALYRRWERIAEHLKCGLVIVHHGTKGSQADKRVVDVGAGASAQSRSADCHIALREHETENCVVLDCRVRSFAPVDPMVLRWEYPLWHRAMDLNPADLKTGRKSRNGDVLQPQTKEKPEPWTLVRFVQSFVSDAPRGAATIEVEAEAAGISNRQVKAFLGAAIETRKVFEWIDPSDKRKRRYATVEQPLTAKVDDE